MSALAKKMMEKYGWKEGEGLGKERTGMKSYVKVVRRDPNVATGLGHAADPAQGGNLASTHAVELDAIYGQLHQGNNKSKKSARVYDSDAEEEEEARSSSRSSSSSSDSERESDGEVPQRRKTAKKAVSAVAHRTKRTRRSRSRSRSSEKSGHASTTTASDSESETDMKRSKREASGDVTRMSDRDLFQRCGGVRLGRAGRHRYFDGKLKRIHDTS